MRETDIEGHSGFRRLKRASYTGHILLFAWIGIAGGATLLVSGSAAGLCLLLIGLVLVIFRFAPAFDSLVGRDVAWTGFPALTFLVNGILILMIAAVARVFIRDPFVLYNRGNTVGLILWSVAAALSIGTLVANILAYRLDRRERW